MAASAPDPSLSLTGFMTITVIGLGMLAGLSVFEGALGAGS